MGYIIRKIEFKDKGRGLKWFFPKDKSFLANVPLNEAIYVFEKDKFI